MGIIVFRIFLLLSTIYLSIGINLLVCRYVYETLENVIDFGLRVFVRYVCRRNIVEECPNEIGYSYNVIIINCYYHIE